MTPDVRHQAAEYTKAHRRKKRWLKAVTCLASVVVFCTTYALILPAITLGEEQCGIPEHVHTQDCYTQVKTVQEKQLVCTIDPSDFHEHTAECYDEDGNLICGREEKPKHVHTDACYEMAEVPADTDTLTCGKEEGQDHHHTALCYGTWELTCGMQEHTHTKACYADPAHKTKESAEKTFCRLTSDDAKICELNANDNTTIYDQENKQRQTAAVRNGDLIKFGFSLKMESYSGTVYDEGRIRFEFVLPLSSEKVAFDLTSMEWLDRSDGFEPVVRNEERSMNGKKTSCQVLTGYALLSSEKVEESIIPGEFAETVSVSVLNLKAGEKVWVQIGAAMETNTWDKTCKEHLAEERLTAETGILTAAEAVSAEKQDAEYNDYLEKIEKLENSEKSDVKTEAEALLQSMRESYQQGLLSDEGYAALCDKAYVLAYGDVTSVAEPAEGSNWILLRDSGWFELYDDDVDEVSAYSTRSASNLQAKQRSSDQTSSDVQNPSGIQVNNTGGTNTSEDGSVSVSKTISGTELENVFDITLKVQTALDVAEIREEPDMAVVIVMDISNTMNSNFGGVTRYAAAMESAENFLDQFAENNSLGISKVGYVAFNTDAHQIFGLQSCSTEAKANELKNTMRTQTGSIINASGYNEAHSRFTNVEAGLAMAADMLNGVSNKNKYIIFLSDGFPTTYIESGYSGYDPYDSTGRFYDHVLNKLCRYGTSYSDEAAIRARKKAATIKNSGIDIFSIGVDVAGQTIQKYITQSENASDYSVVDRTGTTYEVGDASSTEAYKNWLRNSIGSRYYYDSTDADGLKAAYNQIFEEIKHQVEAGSVADWVTSDPIPTVSGVPGTVEFIGFYNKTLELISGNLSGNWSEDGENTAVYQADEAKINWNLKNSGFTIATVGGTTQYTYQLVYRVRLKNENLIFNEGTSYPTNDTTTLQYRNIEVIDENQKVSDPKTVEFPIPSVHGYLSELTFQKVDSSGNPVSGAEFTLRHDDRNCSICKGNGESVSVPEQTNTSNAEGQVKFSRIPSGHKYVLEETRVPDGYSKTGNSYEVEVAYDHITVTVKDYNGNPIEWDSKIVNNSYYELPSTGGIGTGMFMIGGLLLITVAGILLIYNQKSAERRTILSPDAQEDLLLMFFILHQAKYTERKERQMKQMKKLASVLLLIAVVLTMTVGTAFAANVTNDTGHNYNAYQIFSGTQADNSVPLGDVKWGTGIKGDAFLSELKADSRFGATEANIFKDCTTAADVAAILSKYTDKSEEAMAFANVAAKHLTSVATAIKSDKSSTVTLAAGYYLLVDTSMPGDAGAMNSALLQVTNKGDITIEKKYDVPTVDKSVKDTDGTWGEAADVNIGDDVSFKLVGTLPSNYDDYETYKFVFHDTMSKNLKLNGTFETTDTTKVISGVTVKVGETDITSNFNIKYSDNKLTISCSNLKSIAGVTKESKIVVEYTAELLASAEIGQPGNKNTVKLEYSNNPNYTGDGTNEPTSNTPEDEVLVFTYELDVIKVDGQDANKKLKDAEFVLLNSDETKVAKVSNGKFVEWVEDSTITKKTDGTYPAEYTLKSAETTGLFAIAGLDAGTYYLKETKAPAGYNLLKNPIKIVISATLDKSENNPALTALTISVDDDTAVGGALDSGIVSTAVKNNSGATLPETGGIGTTIFYVLGAALVIVAGVLLVTRKRMNKNN